MHKTQETSLFQKGLALFLLIFGIMTIISSSSVLFVESSRQMAGNILLEVLWFNFLAGFLYCLSALGLWKGAPCLRKIILFLFAAHLVMMAYFIAHILRGGLYEMRTMYALSFRTLVWSYVLFFTRPKASLTPLES